MAPAGEITILIFGGETANGKENDGMVINVKGNIRRETQIHYQDTQGITFPNNSYIINDEKIVLAAGVLDLGKAVIEFNRDWSKEPKFFFEEEI